MKSEITYIIENFILLLASSNVLLVIHIPESRLAGLYTANRNIVQMLIGWRSDIHIEVVSELRFCEFVMIELFILRKGIDLALIVHTYISSYLSGRNVGWVQFSFK